MDHHKMVGCHDLSNPPPPMTGVRFEEVFQTVFPTEACFVSYAKKSGGPIPRMTKGVLAALREYDEDLLTTMFVFDYDNPNALDENGQPALKADGTKFHQPWTPELKFAFEEQFFRVVVKNAPWALECLTGYYLSRGGARLIYVLSEPLPVDQAEAIHKALVTILAQAGLTWAGGSLDTRCSDWTRVMRLPRITRDGTANFPLDEFWNFEARLNPVGLLGPGCLNLPRQRAAAVPLNLPQPTQIRCHEILGGSQKPDWYTSLSRDLRYRDAYASLFANALIAPDGARNDTIHRYVGQVVGIMHRYNRTNQHTCTPEDVFALFRPALCHLAKDEDHFAVCWRAVCLYWAKEDQAAEERKGEDAKTTIDVVSVTASIIRTMGSWCEARELEAVDGSALEFASTKMIAATAAGYYVMNRKGYYDGRVVQAARLVPLIRELGMESVIPLGARDKKEAWKPYTTDQIIRRHATIVNEVEGTASGHGNTIRGLGSQDATMVLKLYQRRTDIRGVYHKVVDEWLRMVGSGSPDGYYRLVQWISYALAFDEGPTAALAVTGVPGFGKKLLVQGLGETITSLRTVDAQEASGFQSALMRSPYFIANEGFPVAGNRGYGPSETFRRLTGGDIVKAEKKFKDVVDIRVPVRVLLCANNLDIVAAIAGKGRNLSVDDKHAIAQRLVHLRVPPKAAAWLEIQGGPKFTAGWIAGDGGSPSRNVVAEHFLYLYENRKPVPAGQRFMMRGDLDARMLQGFNTQVGNAPIILEAVAGMLERLAPLGSSVNGAVLLREEGNVPEFWVTEGGVMAWLRLMNPRQAERLNVREVSLALRGILHPGAAEDGERTTFPTARGPEEARWFRLDMKLVVEEAIEHDWPRTQSREVLAEFERAMGKIIRLQPQA
jgi:hypothetical protein